MSVEAPHSSHDAGHLKLEYETGLPLTNGKLIMWLFLSTEIMFFAGLIGTYIVLRFGAMVWPTPHDVHLSEPIGAINTFVLICSSVTIVLGFEAAKSNRAGLAKIWIALTLLLGSLFLGIKMYEYQQKFSHGIYPGTPHSQIYEKPDLYYAQAVRERLAKPDVQKQVRELQAAAAFVSFKAAPTAAIPATDEPATTNLTNILSWLGSVTDTVPEENKAAATQLATAKPAELTPWFVDHMDVNAT
ncbi:MAG: cytochrome c oxidase subunit 3, partial [Planctomycetota bacterium]|nr:cytochrome c oxidase subunit 3 [Planctomycetota bacterium]